MSIMSELLSQTGKTSREMGTHASGTASHEDGALLDGVAVPIVEGDRGTLSERELPVRAVDIDEMCRRVRVASRHGILDQRKRRPPARTEVPPPADAVVDTHIVNHAAGRSMADTEFQDRQALSSVS
jgi:hypothetical protein